MAAKQEQEPIEAIRVRFVGMSADALEEEAPEIDEIMTFLVTAVCTGRGKERMKAGEMRLTARMNVLTLEAQGPPAKPSAGPNLFSVDDDGDDD